MNRQSFTFFIITLLIALTVAGSSVYYALSIVHDRSPLAGRLLWHGSRKLHEIALTFDDGPNSKGTPQVLDILKRYHVKATFFVLGKFIEKNSDLISREALEGHSIGSHTYSHVKGTIVDQDRINLEFTKTDELIKEYSGKETKLFRPPFGYENWRFLSEAELLKYAVILWSLDVGDWNQRKTSKEIVDKIMRLSKNGTIVLLHDGGLHREAVIDALPKVIVGLRAKGYRFVTIDEMIAHL